jgi:hypothetical protein
MLAKLGLSAALAASLLIPAVAADATVVGGSWEDGTQIHWLCEKERIKLPIQITTPDGKVYSATLVCNPV